MFIVKDGLPLVIITAIIGILIVILFRGSYWSVPGWTLIALGLFFSYFFRDPSRKIVPDDNMVLSPADGTVLEVISACDSKTVRIFLSVFNVHLQRSPVAGSVKNVEYKPGKFLPAMDKEAHVINEQNIITIQSKKGVFTVHQIAGILARRVVSWVKPGDALEQGNKIGFIKFGSQVDLEMPASAEVKVKTGDKVRAGITVIAQLR
ncbi:MAG: phosphatidylserine decarboxylase [Elusimicrobiota bacterium]